MSDIQEVVDVEQLEQKLDTSYKKALSFIGQHSTKGKIIGVGNAPRRDTVEGVYLCCSQVGQKVTYHRVG